jgi:hypothetical protein
VRRLASAAADSGPVLVLAAIAGAGSFAHIRDTAAQHGQHGPMSWAVAVCIDLTCVMAARERQRDKRTGRAHRRLSWPTVVLAGGVLLSLAANLAQAQPDAWGWLTAATPAVAFLVAVSMLERRTVSDTTTGPAPAPVSPAPAAAASSSRSVPSPSRPVLAVPPAAGLPSPSPEADGSGRQDGESAPVPESSAGLPGGRAADPLLDFARTVAADHHAKHGQPITRDALRARLGISNQLACDLLRQIRAAADTL